MKLLILNGPNMDLLGTREPEIYGTETYADLLNMIRSHAIHEGIKVFCLQSDSEGELIEFLHNISQSVDGVIINPGAYTHTSIALADALKAIAKPTVEVHISSINQRENYRKTSFIRAHCLTCVQGNGIKGYLQAMDILMNYLNAAAL